MGMHQERCPKCKRLRRRTTGPFDSGNATWRKDPETGLVVCLWCQGVLKQGTREPPPTREERHAAKQPPK